MAIKHTKNATLPDCPAFCVGSSEWNDCHVIGCCTITNAQLAGCITFAKLATLTAGNILVGNMCNVTTSVNPSGDIDITCTGVFSISMCVIVDADLASGVFGKITGLGVQTQDLDMSDSDIKAKPTPSCDSFTKLTEITACDDCGCTPIVLENVRLDTPGAIVCRPLWEVQNNGVAQATILPNGNLDMHFNDLCNVFNLKGLVAITGFVDTNQLILSGVGWAFTAGTGNSIFFQIPIGGGVVQLDVSEIHAKLNDIRLLQDKGSDVVSAGIMTLGTDGNTFDITGTCTINEILATNWQAGSVINLQFDGILTVTHNSGGTNDILLGNQANMTTAAGDVLSLYLNDAADWVEISRSVVVCGGEINTASNVGTGVNIFNSKCGVDLRFNTLIGGTGICVTCTTCDITVAHTAHTGCVTGATTLTIACNAVTLAHMAGGTDGNMITYDASGDPAFVLTGCCGQVLTSNGVGTAPTFQCSAGGNHNLLGTVHSDTTTDTVTRGSIVVGNSTPAWDELVIGTCGQVLTTNMCGDAVWAAAAGGSCGNFTDRIRAIPEVPEGTIAFPCIRTYATAGNKISGHIFPDGVSEGQVNYKVNVPNNLAGTPAASIKVYIAATAAGTTCCQTTRWELKTLSVADGETLNAAMATDTTGTNLTMGTTADLLQILDLDMTTDPVAGDELLIQIKRKSNVAADDYAQDAFITGVFLEIDRTST